MPGNNSVGETLHDRYEVKGLIRSSKLSDVYLAYDKQTHRKVVVKCLDRCGKPSWKDVVKLERLRVEAQILQSLNHPCIVGYVDSWEDSKAFHLVTSHVGTESMKDRFASTRPKVDETLEYVLQLLEVTEYLHKKGVVHRDIKPANIMLSDNIVLLDFGAAEADFLIHPYSKMPIGTPGYMCPESFSGAVSAQCDIYSIGATLLFVLTQEAPSEDLVARLNPTGHDGLVSIVRKAMSSSPSKRFRTVSEMRREVKSFAQTSTPRIIVGKEHYPLKGNRNRIGFTANADIRVEEGSNDFPAALAEIHRHGERFSLIDQNVGRTLVYRGEGYLERGEVDLTDGDIIALCGDHTRGLSRMLKFRN